MGDIHKRTRFLVEKLGPNPNAFSVKTGIFVPQIHFVIGNRLPRKSKPHYDFIYKVLTTFPQVNPYWYILGIGKWNSKNGVKIIVKTPSEELNKLKILYADEKLLSESLKAKLKKSIR